MDTNINTNENTVPTTSHLVEFRPTADELIFEVSGRSDDAELIQKIGRQKPAKARYFRFSEDNQLLAVVKARLSDDYTARAPRSPNSTSSIPSARLVDPLAEMQKADEEAAAKRRKVRDKFAENIEVAAKAYEDMRNKHAAAEEEAEIQLSKMKKMLSDLDARIATEETHAHAAE